MVSLRGVTWNHPRAYLGLFPASDAFERLWPDVRVIWDRHSLHDFEAHPIADLAERYDLIVLDHPSVGDARAQRCLVDLGAHAARLGLTELAQDVAGLSFESYRYGGGLWALPIDAACQVAAYRRDLLETLGATVPARLDEVRALARHARICLSLNGVHALMTFFALCVDLGSPPGSPIDGSLVAEEVGLRAIEILREMLSWAPREVLDWSSVAALEALSRRDDLAYCPYVFGYATYSLESPDRHRLTFTAPPGIVTPDRRGSIVGGAGLAISRRCVAPDDALALAGFLTGRAVQKAMALHGGQPARRSAWEDPRINALFNGFYRTTLPTIDAAYVRPRHRGYIRFQNDAGHLVERFLREPGSGRDLLAELDRLYRRSTSA